MFENHESIRILEADPDLGEGLGEAALARAEAELLARVDIVDAGPWQPEEALPEPGDHLGVLITEGLMTRNVVLAETSCAELVGRGDLLHPWDDLRAGAPVVAEVEWTVLEPSTVALLDASVLRVAAQWPAIVSNLLLRAVARSQALALALAISCVTGLEIRLLTLCWHLADRWGRVGPAGVSVPLPLTHQILGRLVGASRPSVSTAMKALETQGSISKRPGGGWVLHGDPPERVQAMRDRRTVALDARRARPPERVR
jgi:CRP/FNR family transcriptional regulator, cyclic AMP receptor protein